MTQSEPAFCGLGSLAMCFNALGMDPGRVGVYYNHVPIAPLSLIKFNFYKYWILDDWL